MACSIVNQMKDEEGYRTKGLRDFERSNLTAEVFE